MERSSLSLHSLSEADDSRPSGPLACKRPPSPTLQHAASEDNLSSSTGEAPSQAAKHRGNGPGPWLHGQKKSLGKKREESLEAKRRKRRSRSFEVTGQGVRPGAGGRVSERLCCGWGPEGWIPPEVPAPALHHPPCLCAPGWHHSRGRSLYKILMLPPHLTVSNQHSSPAPRLTSWGPVPWRASRATGCQCASTQPLVFGI